MTTETLLYDNCVLKLHTLATLAEHFNSKLKIRAGRPYIDHPTQIRGLMRWVMGDSRDATLEFITRVYRECFELVGLYLATNSSETRAQLQFLAQALERSLDGLQTLQTTYRDNSNVVSQLTLQRDRVDRVVAQIRAELKDDKTDFDE